MSGASTMKNFKTMLAQAALPEATVPICMAGNLVADFEDAERALEEAEAARGDSLDAADVADLADRIEALREQMREQTYVFRLRALPKRRWRELTAAHPPRPNTVEGDDNPILERDRYMGINVDSFPDALVRESLVDPDLDDAEWDDLTEKLTDQQGGRLYAAAWGLNRGDVEVPFSRAASRLTRSSEPE